jgi:hypothetical protein
MKGPVNFPAVSWPNTRRLMRIHPGVVTPECFNRGSSPNIPPGFPLKACGNDGLQEDASALQVIPSTQIKPTPTVGHKKA